MGHGGGPRGVVPFYLTPGPLSQGERGRGIKLLDAQEPLGICP